MPEPTRPFGGASGHEHDLGDLDLAIRYASEITRYPGVLVVGSAAILGTYRPEELPPGILASEDIDIAPLCAENERELSDAIDVQFGEGSAFHEKRDFYVQGVSRATAVVPRGWVARLVPVDTNGDPQKTGWCLEPHDLCVAKLARNDPKDQVFIRALIEHGLIRTDLLLERLGETPDPDGINLDGGRSTALDLHEHYRGRQNFHGRVRERGTRAAPRELADRDPASFED